MDGVVVINHQEPRLCRHLDKVLNVVLVGDAPKAAIQWSHSFEAHDAGQRGTVRALRAPDVVAHGAQELHSRDCGRSIIGDGGSRHQGDRCTRPSCRGVVGCHRWQVACANGFRSSVAVITRSPIALTGVGLVDVQRTAPQTLIDRLQPKLFRRQPSRSGGISSYFWR